MTTNQVQIRVGPQISSLHRELYHYTTAAGLEGIIREQCLRATNIDFLNDAEERVGFFSRRLPQILPEPTETMIKKYPHKSAEQLKTVLHTVMQKSSNDLNEAYVTSFCSAQSGDGEDGLLSQWRAYGRDGGYAIVFDAAGLDKLLEDERQFGYQHICFADVQYSSRGADEVASHDHIRSLEKQLRECATSFLEGDSSRNFEMYSAITALSCLYKHQGFSEEREVRIVAVPIGRHIGKALVNQGHDFSRRAVQFRSAGGLLVPHINLFGEEKEFVRRALPIAKVIVGPHPDRQRRRRAVEILLERYEVKAEVIESCIPYIGG